MCGTTSVVQAMRDVLFNKKREGFRPPFDNAAPSGASVSPELINYE